MSDDATRPAGTRPDAVPFLRLTADDPFWPPLWREMNDPPREVFVSGAPAVLARPALALVGTRRATNRGVAVARRLAGELAAAGWTIVSGLALGVDGAAHRGALEVGGVSVGVMATGIDMTYPAAHGSLRAQLDRQGCCVTEFPPGTGPRRYNFPRRNRLIAALCRGVIVVEAPAKSGAMLTANRALDYDREVFAVPGPVDREVSRGCHRLLREGAVLVECAADVARTLGAPGGAVAARGEAVREQAVPEPAPGSAAAWILARLDLEGVCRDRLRERWPGSEGPWIEGLMALELAGLIRRLPGGRLARTLWRS